MIKTFVKTVVVLVLYLWINSDSTWAEINLEYKYLPIPIEINKQLYPSPFYLYAKCAEINKLISDFAAKEYS